MGVAIVFKIGGNKIFAKYSIVAKIRKTHILVEGGVRIGYTINGDLSVSNSRRNNFLHTKVMVFEYKINNTKHKIVLKSVRLLAGQLLCQNTQFGQFL